VTPVTGAVYDSSRLPRPFLRELQDLARYRDLIVQLVSRDIRTRYKRSVLGVGWTLLNPLLMMAVLTLVFSQLFRADVRHYAVYLLSAQLIWIFFAQTTTQAMNSLTWGGALVSKIYLPRSVFAVSQVGTGLVNLGLALVPLLFITVVSGVPLTWALLWLPIPMLMMACFALGIGLLLSTLAISFPDVVEMYQVILTAWYFLTPIIYPLSALPESTRSLMSLNPAYYLVEAFRGPVYAGTAPEPTALVVGGVAAVVSLVAGWLLFTSAADEIPARL
jgi:homopolymeric O-antigen transport system permease protein